MLNSHMGLVAAILDGTDIEHFHYCRSSLDSIDWNFSVWETDAKKLRLLAWGMETIRI